jgi:parallel beta-helix repeat protein
MRQESRRNKWNNRAHHADHADHPNHPNHADRWLGRLLGILLPPLIILALLLFPSSSFPQASNAAAVSFGPVMTPYTTLAANAPYRVCLLSATGTPCATTGVLLFSDAYLTHSLPNPGFATAQGIVSFFVATGAYQIQVTPVPGQTYTYYALLSAGGGGGGGPIVEVNNTPISPASPANFTNTSGSNGITWTFTSGQIQATTNGSGGLGPCSPAFSVQAANSGVTGFTCDPNITIDTTNHSLDVGGLITGNAATITNLSPVPSNWTLDVTTPTTTLDSIFSLTTTGSCGVATLTGTVLNIPNCSSATGTVTNFKYEGTTLTGGFAPSGGFQNYDYDPTVVTPDAGYEDATFKYSATPGKWAVEVPIPVGATIAPFAQAPIAGQYVQINPNACTFTTPTSTGTSSCNALANGSVVGSGSLTCTSAPLEGCSMTVGFSFGLPAGLTQPQITAVYAQATSNWSGTAGTYTSGECDSADLRSTLNDGTQTQTSTNLGTPTINTLTCTFNLQSSGTNHVGSTIQLSGVTLYAYYTGSTVQSPSSLYVYPPLLVSNGNLGISFPYNFGQDTTSTNNYNVILFGYDFPNQIAPGDDAWVSVTNANTGASTLTVNGGTTLSILKSSTGTLVALAANDIVSTVHAHVEFDGVEWVLENPQTASGGGGTTTHALTAAASGGASPGSTFNGSAAVTFDYHSFGAAGISGTPTTGDCANWASSNTLGDAGSACGGGGGGGYTNVAGSGTQTTVAQLNTLCGSGTLYITTPLTIATGGTITCPTQFSKSGVLTGSVAITFSKLITETDAPSQHFASGLTITLANQSAKPEWWGAMADCTGVSGCAANNLAPIQSCISAVQNGQCLLGGLYGVTGGLTVTTNRTGLRGTTNGWQTVPSGIVEQSATAVTVACSGGALYDDFENFTIYRNATPGTGSIGLSVSNCPGVIVKNTQSHDSLQDYYLNTFPNYGSGVIQSNAAAWGYEGISCPAATFYGFYLEGNTTFSTSNFFQNNVSNNCGSSPTSHAFYIDPANNSSDFTARDNTVNDTTDGWTIPAGTDVQILNSVLQIYNEGYVITAPSSQIVIDGGSVLAPHSVTPTIGASLSSSGGVTITNVNFNGNFSTAALQDSSGDGNVLVHNNAGSCGTSGICFKLASTTADVVADNSWSSTSYGLVMTGSSNNTVVGNNCPNGGGGSTYCISADATSNNNHYLNVNQAASGVPLLNDLGTGNQLPSSSGLSGMTAGQVPIAATATTVTSSKALAGSGTGVTTGPTTSTNLDCVQFTGTAGQIADAGAPCGTGSGGGDLTSLIPSITPTGCTVSGKICTVGTAVSSITIASIPTSYNKLVLTISGRNSGTTIDAVNMTVNSDTSTDYTTAYTFGGASTGNASTGGVTACGVGSLPGTNYAANLPDEIDVTMPQYANTSFFKAWHSLQTQAATTGSAPTELARMNTCYWYSTSAITTIKLTDGSGNNFVVGTTIQLDGEN